MKDEAFATILKGIINQSKLVTVTLNNRKGEAAVENKLMVNLKKIVYCNN